MNESLVTHFEVFFEIQQRQNQLLPVLPTWQQHRSSDNRSNGPFKNDNRFWLSVFEPLNNASGSNSMGFWAPAYSDIGALSTIALVFLVIVVIVFGNTLTIVAVIKERRLRQVQNWFIVSLASADLFVGLVIMPLTLAYEVLGRWALGAFLCELWLALDVLFVTSSILNICVISLDRYWSVTSPLDYGHRRTTKRALVMIASAWIIALLISFPPLVGWRPDRSDPLVCDLSTRIDYVLYSALGSFYVPSLILLGAYVKIYQVTRKRARKLVAAAAREQKPYISRDTTPQLLRRSFRRWNDADLSNATAAEQNNQSDETSRDAMCETPPPPTPFSVLPMFAFALRRSLMQMPSTLVRTSSTQASMKAAPPTDGSYPIISGTRDASNGQLRQLANYTGTSPLMTPRLDRPPQRQSRSQMVRRRELRATAILGFILFGFILCWLPFFMIYVLNAVCCSVPELVFDLFFWLGYCNSALNPIIYAVVNLEFRKAFQKILRLKNKRRSQQSSFKLVKATLGL